MVGSIILLNGISSSGKSAIAHEMQKVLPEPWVILSADRVLGGFPFDHPAIQVDDVWRPLGLLFYETIGRFADGGFNVIAEQVFQDSRQLDDAVATLAARMLWFVGIHCDLDVAEQREAVRRDGTKVGTARYHSERVHRHGHYDIEIDTSAMTAQQAAEAIVKQLRTEPAAFGRIASAE